MPGLRTGPLAVAAAAFALGGLGNVAFSLHAGSQLALATARFAFGLALAAGLLWRSGARETVPLERPPRHAASLLVVSATAEAVSIMLLMAAADGASTAVFTLIAVCSPVLIALLGRPLGLARGTPVAAFLAAAALAAAAAATVSAQSGGVQASASGVSLPVGSAVLASVSAVTGSLALRVYRPASQLAVTCAAGLALSLAWGLASGALSFAPSTLAAALFIALLPGGVAKLAVSWANARSSPQLVHSLVAVSVATATLGGWLLLAEAPTVLQAALSVLAAALVGCLAMLRNPTTAPPLAMD